MKLSIPPLLYAASLGLFGLAVWTACEMLPLGKDDVRQRAHTKGYDEAVSMRRKGREQGTQSTTWVYAPAAWWEGLKVANLTGALPPAPVEDRGPPTPQPPAAVVVRPLEQLIELVSLVYDGEADGKGGRTHVVVRFKPDANVKPPAWWVKENSASSPSRLPPAMTPKQVVGEKAGGPANQGKAAANRAPQAPSLGAQGLGAQGIVQKLWVEDRDDPRRSATLWPIDDNDKRAIGTLRLVRVSDDAQRAYFLRQLPPTAQGEPAPPPTEELLIKSEFDLPQDLLQELLAMRGGAAAGAASKAQPLAQKTSWIETKATTRVDGAWHIGTDDEARFRDDCDRLMETLYIGTYSGRSGTNGLIVKGIDEKLGASLGIVLGDVLLEINGRKVESKAQACAFIESDYQRGVRSFQTRWLSNGQVVDRTYLARGQAQ